jgi:hypothetical protein
MITAVLTCAPIPAGTDGRGTKKRGLRYGGSEKREGRRFVGRKVLRGSEASPLIIGGNGHGSRVNEKREAERAEGAMVVCLVVSCREEALGIVVVSLKDGQGAADLSGHGLQSVASAAEASVWRISTARRTPRM